MTIRFILIFLFIIFFNDLLHGQSRNPGVRYIKKILNDTTELSKPQFLVYPTVAFAPETSWEFGLSTLHVFYIKRDTVNRLSEINGFTFFTLEKQYGLFLDHALYTNYNRWFFLGKFKIQNFPLKYFGIGSETPPNSLARIDASQIQIKERFLRKIYSNLYLGAEVDFQRLSDVRFIPDSDKPFTPPPGFAGSKNLGLGMGIIYDNRHNVLNVRKGLFSELALLHYDKTWGSDFHFTTFVSDNRIFKPVNKRDVFAAQLFGQFTAGIAPFNQLALMGGENLMRGYYLGRFRDKNLVAGQVEYRMLPLPLGFSKRIGAAIFASAGTVFNQMSALPDSRFVYAGGGGLRFLLFPKKDIFTRFDVAFTNEGHGFYIFIGEAF
ncbi:MAG: BamA/TamA family outer membrane protein [Cytophagaceae bacterium]